MNKRLVAILTVVLLAGASRVNDAPDEAGVVTAAVAKVRLVAMRVKGLLLGSLVRQGMSEREARHTLGDEECCWDGGLTQAWLFYPDLGVKFTCGTSRLPRTCFGSP
jgi:hypothetical protein